MKIFFDSIVYSLQKSGGISSYWYEISKRFLVNDFDIYFIENTFNGNIEHAKFLKSTRKIIHNRNIFNFFNRFTNINKIPFNSNFIFHSSYFRITKNKYAINVVTVHDFIHEKYYHGIRKFLHNYQKTYAINNADIIITVSNNTKNDLLNYFPKINPNLIKVVHNGVSDDYFPIKNNLKINNSILFVGSRYKYKNFEQLVVNLSYIQEYNLIIVGDTLKFNEISFLNKYLSNRWTFHKHLNNTELNNLYNTVFALAYVSSYEGFGIPLLEAMKSGCPFIALNKSSIPEVVGDAGVLLDELNVTTFSNGLKKIEETREEIIQKGLERAKLFSWDKCYENTLKIYKDIYYNKIIS